jgi:RNA polymerase sigma-70 factor (ECF subfamily)
VRTLLEEYVPRVYRFALRLTREFHAAEDLTQETFLRALRTSSVPASPGAVRVWLFRITVNVWRDQLRRGKLPVGRAQSLLDEPPSQVREPGQAVADEEELRQALEAMETLPDRQREVLYMSACEGLSAAEIAEVLGVRPDAVKANLCLARKKMREMLSVSEKRSLSLDSQ